MKTQVNRSYLLNPSLLEDFHAGRDYAFEVIFRHFFPMLSVFALKIINDEQVAKDIAQDALVNAWKLRLDFDDLIKIKSFLFTCVKNDCLKKFRKDKLIDKYRNSVNTSEVVENDLLGNIIQTEIIVRIFEEVDHLPEQCKKIIQLIFQEEKKPSEIAELLGISVSTVNSQKMRGLNLLRGKFKDKDYLFALTILIPGHWF